MTDIVTRLRKWTISPTAVPCGDLMDEAADEIERLRLTDKEREAIKEAVLGYSANDDDEECASIAATLRRLLERTK